MDAKELLTTMVREGVADIFIITGKPLSYKRGNLIYEFGEGILLPDDTQQLIEQIYALAENRSLDHLLERGDDDFSFSIASVSRFRVNTYRQRGTLAAVIRVVSFSMPDPEAMSIPSSVLNLAELRRGMVLITGPAGSGKTTTLATIIDRINNTRNAHIITLENPIEFLHRHSKSLVSQREVNIDTLSYATALRATLRQSPDVILIGELRDTETISIALTAAETGHLVFSTLHTVGATNTVDRLVDSFSAEQQAQVRMQLSMVLQSVVSQQLLPLTSGGVVPAFEIMHCNHAVRNLIREGRTHQIPAVINTSSEEGMVGMDASLLKLYRAQRISYPDMLTHALSPDALAKLATHSRKGIS
ncbi:MAG: PilT/PilU family type 4a pilus ATPase [Coriobacteriales bacterium]|jgi:twitching motility protein PilT|nr:PilT/PilU family type 4a pilus ATPase [Coriobacteriales bacterium]